MKHFKNILYIAEASIAQESALARAVSLAQNNQADLTVIDVVPVIAMAGISMLPQVSSSSTDLQSAMVNKRRQELESQIAPYQQHQSIQIEVKVGQMFIEIIRAVLHNQYDLLIKPAENPNFIERLFGSNDIHLLRMCPCPVWLTGPNEKSNYARILAAVDFSLDDTPNTVEQSLNQEILELAGTLALSDFAELHLVHVWDAPAEAMVRTWSDNPDVAVISYVEGLHSLHTRALNRLRDQLRDQIGEDTYNHLSPQFHLHRGTAFTAIPELARQLQADLVVMGTVARTGIAGLFIGNTAETILEQLQCSVLAVKPSSFVSPIKLSM